MEKEETQNKKNQNLKDENLEPSTDKQVPEETEKIKNAVAVKNSKKVIVLKLLTL